MAIVLVRAICLRKRCSTAIAAAELFKTSNLQNPTRQIIGAVASDHRSKRQIAVDAVEPAALFERAQSRLADDLVGSHRQRSAREGVGGRSYERIDDQAFIDLVLTAIL